MDIDIERKIENRVSTLIDRIKMKKEMLIQIFFLYMPRYIYSVDVVSNVLSDFHDIIKHSF